mmetsp:Transcript_156006/g.500266  ORF Transcript_156006/g.500266 Transcript_156006/m.500266 type:complete len:177 (+) Transcript_156006:89-619(+)
MSNFRASSTLAIPPKAYGSPKGHVYKGLAESERFPAVYQSHDEVFEEYLQNKSLSPSRHRTALATSSGLMELHYDTMRKKQQFRSKQPSHIGAPSMDRSYKACAGYSGHIPGKNSGNIVGCPWKNVSELAHETRGAFFHPPGSGLTFTLGERSMSTPNLSRTGGSLLSSTGAELCR